MSFKSLLKKVPAFQRAGTSLTWLSKLLRIWRSPERLFVNYPPGHFYSPLPALAEIVAPPSVTDIPGLYLDAAEQLKFVQKTSSIIAKMPFSESKSTDFRYYYENIYFSYSDACSLFAMMTHFAPARLIEVGSGFSSALMLDTRGYHNLDTRFTFIDPDPTRLNQLLELSDRDSCQILPTRVQEIPIDAFRELDAGDILFIDSSHVSKYGSDVNHLFFEVIPRLNKGVFVHVHDVFWPFDYPVGWLNEHGRAWNEQYVLRAFLMGSRIAKVFLFPSYLEHVCPDEYARHWPGAQRRPKGNPAVGAGSIWLQIC